MNEALHNELSFRFLYYRYKDSPYVAFAMISFVIVLCFILFMRIVLPQIQEWFSIRNEIIATRERIDTINQNIAFLNSLDKAQVTDQFAIATAMLPFEKDFGGVVNALSDASLNASVSIDDFSFQVGSVASISAQPNQIAQGLSTVDVTVRVFGNIDSLNRFVQEIDAKLPLGEVMRVSGDGLVNTVQIRFYQKQFPSLVFQDAEPLTGVSQADAAFLRDISTWRPLTNEENPQEENDVILPLF